MRLPQIRPGTRGRNADSLEIRESGEETLVAEVQGVVVGRAHEVDAHPLQLIGHPGRSDAVRVQALQRRVEGARVGDDQLTVPPGGVGAAQQLGEGEKIRIAKLGDVAGDQAVPHGHQRRAAWQRLRGARLAGASGNEPGRRGDGGGLTGGLQESPAVHGSPRGESIKPPSRSKTPGAQERGSASRTTATTPLPEPAKPPTRRGSGRCRTPSGNAARGGTG